MEIIIGAVTLALVVAVWAVAALSRDSSATHRPMAMEGDGRLPRLETARTPEQLSFLATFISLWPVVAVLVFASAMAIYWFGRSLA